MTIYTFVRSMAGALAACVMTAGVLTGCSDNAASPLPPDSDPLGNNATVRTSDPVSQQEANEVRTNARANANDTIIVQPHEAAETARGQYPNAQVYSINLDYDRDSVNYEVVVKSNGRYYVVVVDPQTGQVIDKYEIREEQVGSDTVIVVRVVTIKVKEARDRAVRIVNGDCVEINLEEIEGRPTYVIIVLTPDNRYVTLYIDADTGRQRKLKDDGECDDDGDGDRHKNKKGRGHYRHGNGKGYGHRYHCHCECTDDDGQQIPRNMISVDSARVIVRSMIDSATINHARLEIRDTTNATYELRVTRDSNVYVFRLNAITGALIEASQTGGRFDSTSHEFQPRVQGDTLVALSVARVAAVAQLVGTVEGWKLAYDQAEAKWIYTFRIRETATGTRKEVLVDAKTGTFIRIR
jgi:uncharacterized membrane protein YkoI